MGQPLPQSQKPNIDAAIGKSDFDRDHHLSAKEEVDARGKSGLVSWRANLSA
jgi:hypothetical protein